MSQHIILEGSSALYDCRRAPGGQGTLAMPDRSGKWNLTIENAQRREESVGSVRRGNRSRWFGVHPLKTKTKTHIACNF